MINEKCMAFKERTINKKISYKRDGFLFDWTK